MSLPPIVSVTLQGVVLSATSNLLAQALTSFRDDKPFIVDWVPVVQFIIWTIVNTPPNYLWYVMIAAQCWCSSHYAFFAPPLTNISRQDFLESTFPAYHAAPTTAAVEKAARSDDAALDQAAARSALARREFVPIITAGWRLWPAVSLVNFAFVKTVPMRNLVGGLAGVGWGIYMSLFAAE
ncbi:Spore wall maturation protein DIT1 [Verticillium dahliae VDG2]|nr:Spore wall maturation protein DIT1 [Verticillium dahliae VDG2]